jgi:hypothetical protein
MEGSRLGRRIFIPPLICGMQAVRRWRRDGSQNLMGLNAAVGAAMFAHRWNRAKALDVLLSGIVVGTPLAEIWAVPLCSQCGQDLVDSREPLLDDRGGAS